ncbi:MAG: Ig-like domain-containing protein, partial [Propionibacteriaceae bacterium]|nr:Ig-like domain-containing protein [Propionibacteriaceae bacterium]
MVKLDADAPEATVGGTFTGDQATLTATTPATAGHYYYWVEVTNNIVADDETAYAPNTISSDFAHAIIVDRTLEDGIVNGDFSQLIDPDGDGPRTIRWANLNYAVVAEDQLPGWNSTQYLNTSNTIGRPEFQVFSLNNEPFGTGTITQGNTSTDSRPYNVTTGHGVGGGDAAPYGAIELASDAPSTVYQDVATVPGRIYEWSLDHAARRSVGDTTSLDVMAVIIGPSINTEADYVGVPDRWRHFDSLTAVGGYNEGNSPTGPLDYRYGVNSFQSASAGGTTDKSVATSYFYDILLAYANADPDDAITLPQDFKDYPGESFVQEYNGGKYYVYIAASNADWHHYTGTYSVPEGSGTTVFGFVSIDSIGDAQGNVLDNIVFASGTDLGAGAGTSFAGGSDVSITTKAGFAYALAEVRGSAPLRLSGLDGNVYFTATGGSQTLIHPNVIEGNSSDWYVPDASGTLTFTDLLPGATYRVVGIPLGAISAELGTNTDPTQVLDEGYYQDVTLAPAAAGDGSTEIGNVTAQTYQDDAGTHARVTVDHTDSRVQYAIVTADGVAAVTREGSPWLAGDTGSVSFAPLDLNTEYWVVSRPSGYSEITPAKAKESGAAVAVTTPGLPDIQAGDVTRTRASGTDTITVTVDAAHNNVDYALFDITTGTLEQRQTASVSAGTASLTFSGLSPTATYQVVQKESGSSWSSGVRAYPAPAALTVDYAGAAVGGGAAGTGPVPASVEYRIAAVSSGGLTAPASATALAWLAGSEEAWVAALGSSAIDLGAADQAAGTVLANLRDTAGAAGGVVSYRLKAGSDGYTGPSVSTVIYTVFPARLTGPVADTDWRLAQADWAAEQVHAVTNLEFQAESGAAWTAAAANSDTAFANLGWTGAVTKSVGVRKAPTSAAFASWPSVLTLPARPAAPSYVRAKLSSDATPTVTLADLLPNTAYAYRLPGSSATDLGAASDWSEFTTGPDQTEYPGLTKDGEGDYWVRQPATAEGPASQYQLVSIPLMIEPVTLALDYGETPEPHAATIVNGVYSPVMLKEVRVEGTDAGAFTVTGSGQIVMPGEPMTTWSVTPVENLDAGTYSALLVAEYYRLDGSAATRTVSGSITLTVAKATWDTSTLLAVAEPAATTASSVTLDISGAPAGAVVEVAVGSAWESVGTAGPDGTVAPYTKTGLGEATTYSLKLRLAGDVNHVASGEVAQGLVYTRFATPTVGQVVRVNYASERLEFLSSVVDTTVYQVTGVPAASPADAVELKANGSLSALAEADFELQVVRKSDGTHPASLPGTLPVTGKRAAPVADETPLTDPAGTGYRVHKATGETATDGWIEYNEAGVAAAVDFRPHSTGDATTGWTTVTGATSQSLPAGVYDLRFPPSNGAFASKMAVVELASSTASLILDANGAGAAVTFVGGLDEAWKALAAGRWRQPYPEAAEVTLPQARWVGHRFLGWTTDPAGTGDLATAVAPDAEQADSVTYYAQWADYDLEVVAGSSTRTGDGAASVAVTSALAGTVAWADVESGAKAPTIDLDAGTPILADADTSLTLTPGPGARDVYVQVRADDGNISSKLKIALPAYTPPGVAGVTPYGRSAPLSGTLTVTFDEPIDQANLGSVTLAGTALTLPAVSATTATYTYGPLEAGTDYTVAVTGFRDLEGNVMGTDAGHTFATPTVVHWSAQQRGGVSGVADSTGLLITFSQEVEASGVLAEPGVAADLASAISVSGATAGALTDAGDSVASTWLLALSDVTVANRADVQVTIADWAGYDTDNDPTPVMVYRNSPTVLSYVVEQVDGVNAWTTTTALQIEFSQAAPGLPAGAITLTGASKGALSDCGDPSEATWCLGITLDPDTPNGGSVGVLIDSWTGFQTPGTAVDVTVYRSEHVDLTFSAAESGGLATYRDSAALVLTFAGAAAADDLTADQITLDGATAGALTRQSDLVYELALSALTADTVTVRIADWGDYHVTTASVTVAVYRDTRADVTYQVAQVGGESGLEDTTALEVTFAGVDAVAGLASGLITLTGATLGTVTEVSPLVYRLGLSGLSVENEGEVVVTLADWAGYDVDDGVHRVEVFRRVGQVVADAAGAWLTFDVIANGNVDEDHVVGDLSLPLSWLHGATIAWRSDGVAVSDAGVVTRPEYTAADATVTLTATVAAAGTDGTVTRDVTFAVTVP